MAINGCGIRDTARVLKIDKNTVISTLKKRKSIVNINPNFETKKSETPLEVRLEQVNEAELDEQWSFVGKNPINVGYGLPLIMQQIQCLLLSLEGEKIPFLRN